MKLDSEVIKLFQQWQKDTGKFYLSIERIELVDVFPFTSDEYFSTNTPSLGLSQNNIVPSAHGYPIYSGKKEPIAIVDYGQDKLIEVNEKVKISFATDGDASAGTNFAIHKESFYVNATRMVLSFKDTSNPMYFYYALLNMKEKYGFNYTKKANMTNLVDVSIAIPVGDKSLEIQNMIVEFIESWKLWKDEMITRMVSLENSLNQAEETLIAKVFKGAECQ
jgi:hypothetical protein